MIISVVVDVIMHYNTVYLSEGSMEFKQRVVSSVNLIRAVNSHELSLIEAGFDVNHQKVSECTEAVCKHLETELGDAAWGWVEWYCYENDFGMRGMAAGMKDNLRAVHNIDDLWITMQECGDQ